MRHKEKGFVDPVSIVGGLFLVVMLVVGTVVAKNKNFSFNINEKASCMTTCMNQVGDQAECNYTCKESTKTVEKVTAPAPKPKEETTKLCGYCKSTTTCVSCSNGGENVGECGSNNDCNKSNVSVPKPTQQSLTTTPIDNSLEAEEVKNIQEVITAPVVINGNVVNPATNVPVIKDVQNSESSNATGSLTASNVQELVCTSATGFWDGTSCIYNSNVSTSSSCGKGCPSGQSCVLIGMGYYGCQNTNTLTNYTEDDTCANRCATNQQCVVNNVVNGKKEYVCKTVEYVPYTPQKNIASNPCPTGSSYINNTCVTNPENITNVENKIANVNSSPQNVSTGIKYSSREECMAKENNNTYICNKYDATQSLYNGLNLLTSGKFGNYVESFQQPNQTWQVEGFASSEEYVKDCVAKNGILAAYGCSKQASALSSEAVTSSIKLGTDITGKSAAIAAIPEVLTAGTFSTTISAAFKSMSAITTAMGTPNTVATCISGSGQDCVKQTIQTGINWVFLGSMDAMNAATTTMNGGQAINAVRQTAIVNGAQAAVNITNTIDACKGGMNLDCGINIAGDALLGYGIYQNGVMAVNLQNSLNNFLATQNANSAAQNFPELTSGQSSISLADDIIDAQVGNIDDVWDEVLGRFVSPISNETALVISQNQIPQIASGAIVQQPNLALLTNVFLNNSQLPVALSVANLNANAIGGGTSNVFNSISPANPTQVSGGQPSATNLTQSPVNLQANQGSNRGSTNQKAPMYYGLDEDPTLPVAQMDWGLVGPNKKPLVMHNGQLWDPDELAVYLKGIEGLSVNPIIQTNSWSERMPSILDEFQKGYGGFTAKELALTRTEPTPQSRLAAFLDKYGVNISFPDITFENVWNKLTGNVPSTEINPLPEIILDPLPDAPAITSKQDKNPIWAIAPDKGSSVIPAQNLVQNGFTPTIHYANVAPRVVNGQLSTNPQVARDLADAIIQGLKCGFNEQTILCNTAGLFIKDALALIPEYLKTDLKVFTTFEAITRTFEAIPKKPLLIGTKPTTLAVSQMNLNVDTLDALGRPDLVDKFQELIWRIKASQGSDVSAAPEAIRSDLYDPNKLIELRDYLLTEVKILGYNKNDVIIPACTELEELCKAGSGLTFVSPFSLIKPPTEQTIIEKAQEQISSIIKEFLLPPDSNALPTNSLIPETGGVKFKIKIPKWLGGSPAGDPNANSFIKQNIYNSEQGLLPKLQQRIEENAHAEIISSAETNILTEYDDAIIHFEQNSPYKPGSANFQPNTDIEKDMFVKIKGEGGAKPQTVAEILKDDKLKLPQVEEIIHAKSFDEAKQILQKYGVEIESVPRVELNGADALTITPKNILIADDIANEWVSAKGVVAHETTHTVLSEIKQTELDYFRSKSDHRTAFLVGEANSAISEEDWAFANGIRADLYELSNNKNLSAEEIATIKAHIQKSIENYNWVVFGNVLPNRDVVSASQGILPKVTKWWDESILNWQNWGGGSRAGDIIVNPDFIEKSAADAVYNYFVTNPKLASEIISDISNPLITKAFELTYMGDDYVLKYPVGPLETRVRFKNDVTIGQSLMVEHGMSENLIPATFVDTTDGPVDIQKFKKFDEDDLFMNLPDDKKKLILDSFKTNRLKILDPGINIYWKKDESTWKTFDPEFVSKITIFDRIKSTIVEINNWREESILNWNNWSLPDGSPAGDLTTANDDPPFSPILSLQNRQNEVLKVQNFFDGKNDDEPPLSNESSTNPPSSRLRSGLITSIGIVSGVIALDQADQRFDLGIRQKTLAMGNFVVTIINQRDVFLNYIKNLTDGPGYYSPTLNTEIIYKDGVWYNLSTGKAIDSNTNILYLQSEVISNTKLQHVTIDEKTFNNEVYQTIRTNIQNETSATPLDVTAITHAVHDNLQYDNTVMFGSDTLSGTIGYITTYRSLENILANNKAICFEFSVTEQAYLAELGIPSTIVGANITGGGHVFLLVTDKENKQWVVDPTINIVLEYADYVKLQNATDINVLSSVYGSTNTSNLSDFTITSSGPISH